MCRSIKTLRQRDVIATDEEIEAAARQFVKKISGFQKPTARHEQAFEEAVDEIAAASKQALRRISRTLSASAR
jgi:hypothetical protein